jgi:hypothetical protein
MVALSQLNRALQQIPTRAERQKGPQLHETFVDCGVAEVIDMSDHQILYGRRGTGKTHAFGYLASEASSRGDIAISIDLRSVGSPGGIFGIDDESPIPRATRMLIDLLNEIRELLLEAVIANEELVEDGRFITRVDDLFATITNIKISGEVEQSSEAEIKESNAARSSLGLMIGAKPSVSAQLSNEDVIEDRRNLKETRRGSEQITLNFTDVARALRKLADTLTSRKYSEVL